ncbi:ABC transporter ATP-binding protein [Salinispira pacifica]|uniref:ABC transporter, ATP-binding/permease protein n=1 Tax=Salinispira pacifica TaxID=1307761 RepID=V5WIZ2_9SPIO|nr:ABC transporter ATP-binding protein [Salinispira pacifica]AHC15590.1 ABC transporter, ATP-binding/permease protein [Salinispira pacifica]
MKQETRPLTQLWQYLRPKHGKILAASAFSVFNKLFDLMPPALIGFAVDIVVNGEDSFLSRFGLPRPEQQLVALALITAVVWLLESLFEYLFEIAWKTLAQQTQDDIRTHAYRHIQNQRYAYFEDKRTGELVTILNEDVNQLERFLDVGANDIIQVITTIAIIGGMYMVVAPGVGWVAVIPIPIIVWASLWFQKFLEPRYAKVREAAGETSSQLATNIQGMATIKSYGSEEQENRRIAGLSGDYRRANESTIRLSSAFIPMIRMIILAGFLAIMLMAGFQALNGAIAVGLYSMMVYIVQRLLWPLTRLGQTFDLYQRAMASIRRIMSILDSREHLVDGDTPYPPEKARGHIQTRDLSFSYKIGPEVLSRVNMEIQPCWTVGIVGPTGAGKTSLIKLFLRLYDVSSGALILDGRDIRDYRLKDLAANIGLVSQDVFLFHGSALDNIAYGKPGADKEEIIRAAKLAEAHDFIMRLPEGYDTIVGERGQKLSGGQRQRISIARAMLKDAPILILDEATSSVDNETEAAIQKSLSRIAHQKTSIVIAHRLSTIRNADMIFVFDSGRIAESGTHDELISQDGLYRNLWRVQSGEQVFTF